MDGEVWLTVSLRQTHATAWADAGHEIAWHQHALSHDPAINDVSLVRAWPPRLNIHQSQTVCVIGNDGFRVTFDTARGNIQSWTVDCKNILVSDSPGLPALIPSFWRAPTDNDRPTTDPYWKRFGLDSMTSQLRSMEVKRLSPDEVQVTSTLYLSPPILYSGFDAIMQYNITADGAIDIKAKLKPHGSNPATLPRIGLDLKLNKKLAEAKYFGPGPGESYPDKKASQKMGIYISPVKDLFTNYEVPQESGNRMDTRWVQLVDESGFGVRATRLDDVHEFSWAAGYYSPAALDQARHPCDLMEEEVCLARLDVATSGVGTGACGPGIGEDVQVKCEEAEFSFRLQSIAR